MRQILILVIKINKMFYQENGAFPIPDGGLEEIPLSSNSIEGCVTDIIVNIDCEDQWEVGVSGICTSEIISGYEDTWDIDWYQNGIKIPGNNNTISLVFNEPGENNIKVVYDSNETVCSYFDDTDITVVDPNPQTYMVYLPMIS